MGSRAISTAIVVVWISGLMTVVRASGPAGVFGRHDLGLGRLPAGYNLLEEDLENEVLWVKVKNRKRQWRWWFVCV